MSTEDHAARLDRIEGLLASQLGVNLSAYDGQDVQAARAAKLEQAGQQAAELVKSAFTEEPLTLEQRLARIETALRSGGALA